jgi:hypothetical protein
MLSKIWKESPKCTRFYSSSLHSNLIELVIASFAAKCKMWCTWWYFKELNTWLVHELVDADQISHRTLEIRWGGNWIRLKCFLRSLRLVHRVYRLTWLRRAHAPARSMNLRHGSVWSPSASLPVKMCLASKIPRHFCTNAPPLSNSQTDQALHISARTSCPASTLFRSSITHYMLIDREW